MNRKPGLGSSKNHKQFMKLIFVSVIALIVVALPSYEGGELGIFVDELSVRISGICPQLVILTENRASPHKALILLIGIILLAPTQLFYLMWNLDKKEIWEKYLSEKTLLDRIQLILAFGISILTLVLVFHIPIDIENQPSRRIGRTLFPILRSEIGYGVVILILVSTMIYLCATLLSAIRMAFNNKVDREGR